MSAPKVNSPYGPNAASVPPVEAAPNVLPRPRRTPEVFDSSLNSAARLRLGLQLRAAANARRHLQRAILRFGVLLGADALVFMGARGLVRAVRDELLLGSWLGHAVASVVPRGYLNGFQYFAALLVGLFFTGNYGEGDKRRDARGLFMACALATALPLWMDLWTYGLESSMLRYVILVVGAWLFLVSERFAVDRVVARVRDPRKHAARTLFVGSAKECRTASGAKMFADPFEFRNVGWVDVNQPVGKGALGGIDDFSQVVHRDRIEVVVLCGQLEESVVDAVVDAALIAGCRLISMPRSLTRMGVSPNLVWRHGDVMVELTAPALRAQYLIIKRAMDIAVSALGLVVLSPVFALVALLVRLDSAGPVIFAQSRVGRAGRVFRIFKFRTMYRDAEQRRDALRELSIYSDGRLFKIENDPRITRVGAWLRRTSLDELPQLWNVLTGDMSLVGPRPPLPSEVVLYEVHHYARFDVKPGITGPWQVGGRNRITDFETIVRLETDYIRQWSVLRDIAIMARTVPAVLAMRGAH